MTYFTGIMRFNSRYSAQKETNKMVGWKTKVIKMEGKYVIQCNGTRYLMEDGYVR